MMNIEPKFDPYALKMNELPATELTFFTPGVPRAMASIFAITFCVRWEDDESGS